MISDTERYHGYVFSLIVRSENYINIKKYPSSSNASFVVNGVGLFIKYSTKRMSPWSFTFLREHQDEIQSMVNNLNEVVVALICGDDGVASLNYSELKTVLDKEHKQSERISISRPPRGKYKIKGTDGSLKNRIGINEFPGKIFRG
jgi:hypothetical protein